MAVRKKVLEHWTSVERVVIDKRGEPQVKSTTCCCAAPGAMGRICARQARNKWPCRCFCHSKETEADWQAKRRLKAQGMADDHGNATEPVR
jgi:hypothetical protein